MNYRYQIFMFAMFAVLSTSGMWQQISGQKTKKKRDKIFFQSTATLSFNKECPILLSQYVDPHNINHDALGCSYYQCDGNCYKTPTHPLIAAGIKPYQWGNGGLLNPYLKEYSVTSVIVEGGVKITLKGIVEADGFAPQIFNQTHIGQSNDIKHRYEPETLEELILGAITERAADERYHDYLEYTDAYFNGRKNQERFEECVRQEWSGSSNSTNRGRTNECAELMSRYCPRSIVWRSGWNKSERMGVMDSSFLSTKFGPDVTVVIDTFQIHVVSNVK